MIWKILCLVEALLLVILVFASGFGFFLITSFLVHQIWGPEWLTTNALLVFLLGGFLLAAGIIKLLELVQYELLHIRARKIEEEMSLDEEAKTLFEHLRVK